MEQSIVVKRKYKFRKLSKNVTSVINENHELGVRTTTEDSSSNIHSFSPPPALPENIKVCKRFAQTSEQDIFAMKENRFEEKNNKMYYLGYKNIQKLATRKWSRY